MGVDQITRKQGQIRAKNVKIREQRGAVPAKGLQKGNLSVEARVEARQGLASPATELGEATAGFGNQGGKIGHACQDTFHDDNGGAGATEADEGSEVRVEGLAFPRAEAVEEAKAD